MKALRYTLAIAALSLAGCALTPLEVATQGTAFTGPVKGTAAQALQCASRAANYSDGLLPAPIFIDEHTAELIIRVTIDPSAVMSVWTFKTTPEGTTYEAKVNPALDQFSEKHVNAVIKGC